VAREALKASSVEEERRDRMRSRLAEVDAPALIVSSLPNIRYLSGFTGSAGLLIVLTDPPDLFFTDHRYRAQVALELDPAIEIVVGFEKSLTLARNYVRESRIGRLAFEQAHVTVAEWQGWRESGIDLVGVDGWVEALRAVKSSREIEAIRRAAGIADRAFQEVLDLVRVGVAERVLAAELDRLLILAGADSLAFPTIVAVGERSALPHAQPTARTLVRGEVVLFDFGAVVEGYHSDLSRTVACGMPDPELAAVYEVVLEAQRRAIDTLSPGMSGREADAVAREVIENAGHGDHFGHSLGHGIGLEVHEAPRLGRTSEDRLESHAVVTVEPGIYIIGLGGVRIEDDVLVGPRGAEVLTAAPKDELITL
jgi:Xaa-Pro aminopeptidase